MAAINEVNLERAGWSFSSETEVWAKQSVARALWLWILDHQDDDVFTLNLIIFKKTVKWRHLFPALERLLGPRPKT